MLGAATFQGIDGIESAIFAKIQKFQAGSGVTVSIVAGGSRGADKNALIAKTQAKPRSGRWKRDPFYLSQATKEKLRFLARGLASEDGGTRSQAATDIGNVMLTGVLENVEKQRNPDGGGFTKLTPNYAAYKRRKFGFTTPILRATGDLLSGLKVQVERTS